MTRGGFKVGNGINWKGQVFTKMSNWTATHKMTGVGNALKRHYHNFLWEYERANQRDVAGDRCAVCHQGVDVRPLSLPFFSLGFSFFSLKFSLLTLFCSIGWRSPVFALCSAVCHQGVDVGPLSLPHFSASPGDCLVSDNVLTDAVSPSALCQGVDMRPFSLPHFPVSVGELLCPLLAAVLSVS